MRKQFWEIIKDDRSKTYEVLGLSTDDTALRGESPRMSPRSRRAVANLIKRPFIYRLPFWCFPAGIHPAVLPWVILA